MSVRDQLRLQLELQILGGDLANGQRLPSVRALARRLKIHPNTVSAAYRDLEATGHVRLQRGAGVFVVGVGPSAPQEARGLDEMMRLALNMALNKGYSGAEIRAVVERWLRATPAERVLVIDPSREMGELLVHELRRVVKVPVTACALDALARDPGLLSGALAVCLPYHAERVRQLVPSALLEMVNLEVSDEDRQAILALPPGAIVLVVSYSPTVLPFADVVLRSLRGDEMLVEARSLSAEASWRRLVPAADMVFADALSLATVRKAKPRKLREFRLVPEAVLRHLAEALTVIVLKGAPGRAI